MDPIKKQVKASLMPVAKAKLIMNPVNAYLSPNSPDSLKILKKYYK